MYDRKEEVVYDYKFVKEPGTGLKKQQIEKIKAQGPKNVKKIVEVNPIKKYGPSS